MSNNHSSSRGGSESMKRLKEPAGSNKRRDTTKSRHLDGVRCCIVTFVAYSHSQVICIRKIEARDYNSSAELKGQNGFIYGGMRNIAL